MCMYMYYVPFFITSIVYGHCCTGLVSCTCTLRQRTMVPMVAKSCNGCKHSFTLDTCLLWSSHYGLIHVHCMQALGKSILHQRKSHWSFPYHKICNNAWQYLKVIICECVTNYCMYRSKECGSLYAVFFLHVPAVVALKPEDVRVRLLYSGDKGRFIVRYKSQHLALTHFAAQSTEQLKSLYLNSCVRLNYVI